MRVNQLHEVLTKILVNRWLYFILYLHQNLIKNMKNPTQSRYIVDSAATIALELKKYGIPDVYSAGILFFGQSAYDKVVEAYSKNEMKLDLYDLGLETEVEFRQYFLTEYFQANRSWFYNDEKFWKPRIEKMTLLDMASFFLVGSDQLWQITRERRAEQLAKQKPAKAKRKAVSAKENIRISTIAYRFTDLKKLNQLIIENPEYKDFLSEFAEMPISQLENLGVEREAAQAFFIIDAKLDLTFLEQFREIGRSFLD